VNEALIDIDINFTQIPDRELVTVESNEIWMEEGEKHLRKIGKLLEMPINLHNIK
jgi:hypothetical protein